MAKPTRILIADDDREFRTTLSDILASNGYSPVSVTDGDEAIDYLKANQVELLILDIMMPRVSGLEVLRHVQKHAPKLKVVVLSGYLGSNLQKECEELGAIQTLTKPYDLEDLMAIVTSV